MKTCYISLLTMLFVINISAQTQIKGKVLDSKQQALEFVNVLLLSSVDSSLIKGNVTDANGQYILEDIKPGDYLLSHKMIGYQTKYAGMQISAGARTAQQTELIMIEDIAKLEEVVVTAEKPLFEHKLDRMIVNVQNSVTSAGANALEVLARSPGVRIDGINTQISMNGSQGVNIQINGKPSRLSGDALIQLLQAMPADNIEKIELISTPPASYDAEGTAGIINIILVKNLDEGTMGSYTLNAAYGERPKFGGSINLNIRKNKWYIYSDLAANSSYIQEDVSITKVIRNAETLLATDTYSNRPAFRGFYNARFGVDYNLGQQTTLGLLLSGYISRWDLDAATTTTVHANGELQETSQLRSLERNDWQHGMSNLNLRHTFANKAKLSVDYDYLEYWNENPADYTDVVTNGQGEIVEERSFISRKTNPINFHVFKADYSMPLAENWNLEMGIKGSVSDFANDNTVADIVNGAQIVIPRYTNLISMDENIYAAYVSTDWQFSEKTSAKAGVRYEYTDVNLSSTSETLADRMYGRLFPSLFLSHNINDHNSLQFSYSERIQRPSLNVLAPAFFFFSPNTLTTGNPQVRATLTRQFRASYRHKTLMVSLQISDNKYPVFWGQINIIPEENLSISQPQNMQDGQNVFLMISFPIQITKWWESRYEGGVAWQQQRLVYEGELVTQRNVFAGFNAVQTFKFAKDFIFEIDGYLETGYDYGLASSPMQGRFNVGLRKAFSNGSNLSLNWQDAFDLGSFFRNQYQRPELNLVFDQLYQKEGSIFRLTYSKTFGNKKLKKNQYNNGASSDERNRVQ